MFAVLDTNHFSEWAHGSAFGENLKRRSRHQAAGMFVSIVTAQEVCQEWFAVLNRNASGRKQIPGYAQFQHSLEMLMHFDILPFDDDAATAFESLQSQRTCVGTMDLKIAAICIAHDAALRSRNLVDFEKVPGLRVENWLD